MLAQHPHRQIDTAADDRFACPRDQPGQRIGQPLVIHAAHQLARHDQTPGSSVDEERFVAAQMNTPIAVSDLVADQRVARSRIGNAQQRFGQTHQRNALLAGERIFLNQPLDSAALAFGPQCGDEFLGGMADGPARFGRHARRFE